MSDVRKTPVALTTSDWHIRSTVPASRAELDWFEVMEKRMAQVKELQADLGMVPILVAGDLFDKHNPPSTLVTWAMRNLPPDMYCICGQHDELGWDYDSRMRGAYGALVEAGTITDIPAGEPFNIRVPVGLEDIYLWLWGMPWERYELPKKVNKDPATVRIILAHKYVYSTKDTAYVGVEESDAVTAITGWAKHADVIAIGDNHQSWRAGKFINHGSLFSTTSAQKDHEHLFGIVYSDGSLETIKLPEEKKWKDVYVPPEVASKADLLLAELSAAELDAVAFDELLDRLEGKLSDGARAELRALRS